MARMCILGTSTLLSYAFWWGADAVGLDFMWAFLISGVGAISGCVVGWRIHQRFFN